MYTPQEIKLAHELADALNDQPSLTFYLSATKKYSHRILRATLQHVLAVPDDMIRKSRGALFTHIISNEPTDYDNEATQRGNSWN